MSGDGSDDPSLHIRSPLLWHGTYLGEPVVVMPLSEFERFTGGRLGGPGGIARRLPLMKITQWERDPELAAFVRSRLGKVPQTVILKEIAERFGAKRTPTKSALNRFAANWKLRPHRFGGG